MALVTIITAAFNCEKFIGHAIESIQSQTYTNWELLIADDGSTDTTRDIIDKYAQNDLRIKTYHNRSNEGIVRTRNKLLEKTTGDYITLLDADDWIDELKLEKQVEYLENSSFKAVGVNYYYVLANGVVVSNEKGAFRNFLQKEDIFQLPFWLPSIMITKDLLQVVGKYDSYFEDNACYEDLYWIYAILETTDIGFIKEPLYYYRHNSTSVTKTLNLKRLASKELIEELINQRMQSGTDWLKKNRSEEANSYVNYILGNKRWAGSCYQTYAAIKIDENEMQTASHYLIKAFQLSPFNLKNIKTLLYYLRRKFA